MTLQVLQSKEENNKARAQMQQRAIDLADRLPVHKALLEMLGKYNEVKIGDTRKSWDVLKTVEFIEQHAKQDEAIVDIGAYGSEILPILYKLGYRNLVGVDLNPKLTKMPHPDKIRYVQSDFMKTPLAANSCKVVTSISVIEHGFNGERLLTELARLLTSGGYFLASFDYWPEKIDTTNLTAFEMDWRIFSQPEVAAFIKQAADYGFKPVGDLHFEVAQPSIKWNGKAYTFAWLALQKQ